MMSIASFIDLLEERFPGDQVAIGGTSAFEILNKSYLSLLQSELKPAAIFPPRSAEEVAQFVKEVKPFVFNDGVQFAVRGAGQQPAPGCSNITNGITLDLRFLTGIDLKNGLVSIGAGERWGPVYEKLSEHGLGVTGGRSALGGIGGLALAGKENMNFHHSISLPLTLRSAYIESMISRWFILFFLMRRIYLRQCRQFPSGIGIWRYC